MTPEVTPPPRPFIAAAAFAPVGAPQLADEQKPTHEAVLVERGQLAQIEHYGWRTVKGAPSLQEVNSTVRVPRLTGSWPAKLKAFAGLGFVISVGYMDPGNWATDLSGGAQFGYRLLFVVLLSSIFSMFLQYLALKLGAVTERDLAQACREAYPRWVNYSLWIIAEVAITATDLAEVIGAAIALNLLFGIPLWAGVLVTSVDALFILLVGLHNFRLFELLIFLLVATIAGCFAYELAAVGPDWGKVATGLLPHSSILTNPDQLYIGLGILGATVMPHNLYLHSSIIQTRNFPRTTQGKRMAVLYGTIDSTISLCLAFFVNAAILILAAAAFFYTTNPYPDVDVHSAYSLLAPAVGQKAARVLFGVALLCSGQNATITGTLAGQIVMEGFVNIRMKPWLRRLLTRLIAIIPAAVVAGVGGQRMSSKLLVLSQVVLSLALSFAVVPLVHFTSSKQLMGKFVNGLVVRFLAILLAVLIAGLNGYLFVQVIRTNQFGQA
eukprot:TRINITY_DN879_c0_g1_i5.p1 TRINITY_DN879_c0_g1~~TRINITY_DN879_c0_g1_i5.p1  ORF type:complete len:495 (+),score=61.26 TRINITY_DN879_c0_g1_i5:418-1902(+)